MNFLFDENFPKADRPILEALGHQVFDFRQEGVRGSSDEMILRMAAEKSAVILSSDRDFFDTLGRRDSAHRGIVVIALKQPNRAALIKPGFRSWRHLIGLSIGCSRLPAPWAAS